MLKKYPWIFLVIIFLMSLSAWIVFIILAQDYAPEMIEAEHHDTAQPTEQTE